MTEPEQPDRSESTVFSTLPPVSDVSEPPATPPPAPKKQSSFWKELPVLVAVAVGLALLIKTFLLQAFFIPSGSMQNTLAIGDRVLVNKLVYDFRNPHRGEIVVFDGNGTGFENVAENIPSAPGNIVQRGLRDVQGFLGLGGNPSEHDFIKRVIGVGGDTVECPASTPGDPSSCQHVVVNGKALDESSYLFEDNHRVFAPQKIKKGYIWVMGDHRGSSSDSRDNGQVPVSHVVGRAFVTIWPFSHVGGHGVPKTFNQHLSADAPALALGAIGVAPIGLGRAVQRHRRRRRRVA